MTIQNHTFQLEGTPRNSRFILSVPDKITGLAFVSRTTTSLTFGWTADVNADTYNVYVGSETTPRMAGVTNTQTTLTGLNSGTSFDIRVSATNEAGEGEVSDAVTMTTDALSSTGSLVIPSSLMTTALGESTIAEFLHWSGDDTRLEWIGHTTHAWQILAALDIFNGETRAVARMKEQIAKWVTPFGSMAIRGGHRQQFEMLFCSVVTLLKAADWFWDNELTSDQRYKISLQMEGVLYTSAWIHSDYNHNGNAVNLRGFNDYWRNWQGNYMEGQLGCFNMASIYFGGPDIIHSMLDNFDLVSFRDRLAAAQLYSAYWSYLVNDPWPQWFKDELQKDWGGDGTLDYRSNSTWANAPSVVEVENALHNWSCSLGGIGTRLWEPFDVYYYHTNRIYNTWVLPGVDNISQTSSDGSQGILENPVSLTDTRTCLDSGMRERGITYDGSCWGVLVSGISTLPNYRKYGQLHEFDSSDGDGRRSSAEYVWGGFRPNLLGHIVLVALGYWPSPGSGSARRTEAEISGLLDRMRIGVTDLDYKLEKGYKNYSRGSNAQGTFSKTTSNWRTSFNTLLPFWFDVLEPYHSV